MFIFQIYLKQISNMILNSLQDFYKFFQKNSIIMSIDYGLKKIGTAVSDPSHTIAHPLKIIKENNDEKKIQAIKEIVDKKSICAIVVGLPLNMDGTNSKQTELVKEFTNKLSKILKLPIFMQDERLTSKAANSFLKEFEIKRKKRNLIDDLAAASMILETTLDSIKNINNS